MSALSEQSQDMQRRLDEAAEWQVRLSKDADPANLNSISVTIAGEVNQKIEARGKDVEVAHLAHPLHDPLRLQPVDRRLDGGVRRPVALRELFLNLADRRRPARP